MSHLITSLLALIAFSISVSAEVTSPSTTANGEEVLDCTYPSLEEGGSLRNATQFFHSLQARWPELTTSNCLSENERSNIIESPIYENLGDINQAVDLIDNCEANSGSDITNELLNLLDSDQIIRGGVGYHLPASILQCIGKIHANSGNCEVSRRLREPIHRQAIREQLEMSGRTSLAVFEQINCRDVDQVSYFLEKASDSSNYRFFQSYSRYLTEASTVSNIQNLRSPRLERAKNQFCRAGQEEYRDNHQFMELRDQLGICE